MGSRVERLIWIIWVVGGSTSIVEDMVEDTWVAVRLGDGRLKLSRCRFLVWKISSCATGEPQITPPRVHNAARVCVAGVVGFKAYSRPSQERYMYLSSPTAFLTNYPVNPTDPRYYVLHTPWKPISWR